MTIKFKTNVESLCFTEEEWRALKKFGSGIDNVCRRLNCEECPFRNHILCELRNITDYIEEDFKVIIEEKEEI